MSITINGKTYTDQEWQDYLTARYGPKGDPIPVDEQAILALERVSTGADIHDTNALVSTYISWCKDGRQKPAEDCKRKMYLRAIRLGERKAKSVLISKT